MKKETIQSQIINNKYLSQYTGKFSMVYFETDQEVEEYEQLMSGNKDDNTWLSWLSCKEKFQFPCWIMCYYVPHHLGGNGSTDYTAIYMTKEEVVNDLSSVIKKIDDLN